MSLSKLKLSYKEITNKPKRYYILQKVWFFKKKATTFDLYKERIINANVTRSRWSPNNSHLNLEILNICKVSLKFIYSEKATQFCEMCTAVK